MSARGAIVGHNMRISWYDVDECTKIRCTEERYRASYISKKLLLLSMKAGMLNDIELARDVVATERGSCRGTFIGQSRTVQTTSDILTM
jgi:hypothetical protein